MTETPDFTTAMNLLASRTSGPLYTPQSDAYDEERTGFQRLSAHQPAVIVGATDERDVIAAINYATTNGARVAVQASGHGLTGAMDGGVLISTGRMSGVNVDPRKRTAWVEAGASWRHVIDKATAHGLAPLSGSSAGVGAVPYTLGGGVGLLARRYGFAADHVRRIDLVTAEGKPRQVTRDNEPELFWALRGGGGNFGVVTGMEIDLMPVSRLYGGGLYFDVEQVPDALEAWRKWTSDLPQEMTSAVAMLPFPDLPMIPEALRGRHVAQIQIAYLGSRQHGEQLVQPLRALGPRLRDTLHDLPYSESGTVFDEPDQAHAYRSTNLLVDDLDSETLTRLQELAGPNAPVMCVVGIRHLGGALATEPLVANAVGHRKAGYSIGVLSAVEPGQEETARAVHREALESCVRRAVGRSLNFSFDQLDAEQVRSAFEPDDYRRLVALKTKLDPNGVFHCNHAIPSVSTVD